MDTKWTAEQIPDLDGRTVIVTGANSGLGRAATEAFARKGAHVVMACRNMGRAHEAARAIHQEVPDAALDVMELDLAELASVRRFAEEFHSAYDALHILVNNAGVMFMPYEQTVDEFELHFGTNHLGHFALTGLLLDKLVKTDGERRVVTMSSGGHHQGEIDFEDLQHRDSFDAAEAYSQSKLANLLFTYELQRRFTATDLDVKSVAAHPGWTTTNLLIRGVDSQLNESPLRPLAVGAVRVFSRIGMTPDQGVLPLLYAATASDVAGGNYYGPTGIWTRVLSFAPIGWQEMRGHPSQVESSSRSHDENTAHRLWNVSEELTGVEYNLDQPTVQSR